MNTNNLFLVWKRQGNQKKDTKREVIKFCVRAMISVAVSQMSKSVFIQAKKKDAEETGHRVLSTTMHGCGFVA